LSSLLALWMSLNACSADQPVSADSVIFDYFQSSPRYYVLPDGEEYFFTRYDINQLSDGAYYVDRYYNRRRNQEIDRLMRTVITFDDDGNASLDMNPKARGNGVGQKLVQWLLPEQAFTKRVEDYFRGRELMAQKGREMPREPEGFDRYIADGLLVKSLATGCDPLGDYARISFARTDSNLKRINETNHNRSLVMLSDEPTIISGKYYYSERCPLFVEQQGHLKPEASAQLQLRAVTVDFFIYRLEKKFLLAAQRFSFAVLVDSLTDDFCTVIESRDATGKARKVAFLYTSAENLSRLLPNVSAKRKGETIYQQYTNDNLVSFDALSKAVSGLSCTTVRK
jgi:hypothetical protein